MCFVSDSLKDTLVIDTKGEVRLYLTAAEHIWGTIFQSGDPIWCFILLTFCMQLPFNTFMFYKHFFKLVSVVLWSMETEREEEWNMHAYTWNGGDIEELNSQHTGIGNIFLKNTLHLDCPLKKWYFHLTVFLKKNPHWIIFWIKLYFKGSVKCAFEFPGYCYFQCWKRYSDHSLKQNWQFYHTVKNSPLLQIKVPHKKFM